MDTASPFAQWADDADVCAAADHTTPGERLHALWERHRPSVLLASHPGAPEAWLIAHATTNEAAVLRALAGNPNTPVAALAWLADPFPHAVLANPVLPLLVLENPNWLLHLPANAAMKLLACADVPAALVRQQARHANACVREAAAMHVAICGTQLDDWEAAAHEAIRHKDLVFLVAGDAPTVNRGYFPNVAFLLPGAVPAWLLHSLLAHDNQVNQHIAYPFITGDDPTIDAQERDARRYRGLAYLQHVNYEKRADDAQSLAERLCSSPATSEVMLRQLAAEAHEPTGIHVMQRWFLAQNPALPLDLMRRFADDPMYAVRDAVMLNPACPPDLARAICVRQLMADVPTNPVFYRTLAFACPVMPPAFLARHAAAPDWLERYAIARNPQTPPAVLSDLAYDGVLVVRMAAQAHLCARLLGDLATARHENVAGDSL